MTETNDAQKTHPTPEQGRVIAALAAALPAVTVVDKGRTADTGSYSYEYADIGDVVNATRPALAEHGLVALTPVHDFGDRLACSVAILHESGERLDFPPLSFPRGKDAQATGSAITYHRRYALCSALGIATGDDDDGAAAKAGAAQSARPAKKQAVRKKAASKRAPAKAKTPEEIVKPLLDAHGSEHAGRVIRMIERMNAIPDGSTRKAIKEAFTEEHGSITKVGPETIDEAVAWLDEVLEDLEPAEALADVCEVCGMPGGEHVNDCPGRPF